MVKNILVWGYASDKTQLTQKQLSSLCKVCEGGWGFFGMISTEGALGIVGNCPWSELTAALELESCAFGEDFAIAVTNESDLIHWGWHPISKR